MKRRMIFFAVLAGLLTGAGSMFALGDVLRDDDAPGPPAVRPTALALRATPAEPVLLVWTPDGLPATLAADVAALPSIARATEVRGDTVRMTASFASDGSPVDAAAAGYVFALDALSVDPSGYASFLPKGATNTVASLAPGDAILGTTSARLRRLAPGASLVLDTGERVHVRAVLADALVGGAEVVVAHDALSGVRTPRFVLVEFRGTREQAEREIRSVLPEGTAVRFRAPGETPLLRHGDAVLSQADVKQRFGEFTYRPGPEREIAIDPSWAEANIVVAELPLLGRVRCHRAIIEELRAVLVELEQRNLGYLVLPEGSAGCFVPRLISEGGALSRHAWGIAIDLNASKNPQGAKGAQDERLIDAFAEEGFAWGGPWLVPDI
jgi:hypothetical protein